MTIRPQALAIVAATAVALGVGLSSSPPGEGAAEPEKPTAIPLHTVYSTSGQEGLKRLPDDPKGLREVLNENYLKTRGRGASNAFLARGADIAGAAPVTAAEPPGPIELTAPNGVRLVRTAFTPDGAGVVAAGYDDKSPTVLYTWDLKTGRRSRLGTSSDYAEDLHALDWSPDGRSLILVWATEQLSRAEWVDVKSGTLQGMLRPIEYTEYADGKPAKIVKYAGWDVCGLSPGGRELVSLSPAGVVMPGSDPTDLVRVDFRTGREIKRMRVADERPPVAAHPPGFTSDGSRIAFAERGYDSGQPEQVWVWDMRTGKSIRQFRYIPNVSALLVAHATAFSRSGRYLATYLPGWSGVYLWDLDTGKGVALKSADLRGGDVAPCHTSDRMVISSWKRDERVGELWICDPRKETVVAVAKDESKQPIEAIAVTPDDARVLWLAGNRIYVRPLPKD